MLNFYCHILVFIDQEGAVPSPEPGCDAHAVLNAQINWQRFLAANSAAATEGFPLVLEVVDDYTLGIV